MEAAEKRTAQRKAGIAARDALSGEERSSRSAAIVERILHSELWQQSRYVLSYKAIKGEADLSALEEAAKREGKLLLYPLCHGPGEMIALLPGSESAWKTGSFGITEPIRELSEEIPPEKIDLLLCPCSAFDAEGRRMGMGGGYYDRFLPRCRGTVTAVAFEAQRQGRIETEPWDVPMKYVFTEKTVYEAP